MKNSRRIRAVCLLMTFFTLFSLTSCFSDDWSINENDSSISLPVDLDSISDGVYFPDAEQKVILDNGMNLTLSDDKSHYIVGGRNCTDENAVIPESYEGVPVTELASMMLFDSNSMKTISIPNTITRVGLSAFSGCDNLEYTEYGNAYYLGNESNPYLLLSHAVNEEVSSVTIHEETRIIGPASLYHCQNLKEIVIPDSVITIENIAFYCCESLGKVTFGEGLRFIGGKAFYGCHSLKSVNLPDGLEIIENYAFYGCPLTFLNLGKSVETVGEHTFDSALITTLVIPGSLKRIDFCAFRLCESLISVEIREGVEIVGESAFSKCSSLTSVSFPSSLKAIEDGAFGGCNELKISELPGSLEYIHTGSIQKSDNVKFSTYGNGKYISDGESDYAYLVWTPYADLSEVIIHPETKLVAHWLFRTYDHIKSISMEGEGKHLTVKGNCVIDKETGTLMQGLPAAVIPDDGSVKSIADEAFYALEGLSSVVIPDGVESIGKYAFYKCSDLTDVKLGAGIETIGEYAFSSTGLTSVTFSEGLKSIGEYAFERIKITEALLPDSLTSIGNCAFQHCEMLENVSFGSSLESIGRYSFTNCGLKTLYLPENVKDVGLGAFNGCDQLESVRIDAEITALTSSVFMYCDSLKSVTLPKSLKEISSQAFFRCYSLSEIIYGSTIEEWNKIDFEGFDTEVTVICTDGSFISEPVQTAEETVSLP